MTLNACHRDFSALIDRIEMERKLESCPQSRSVTAPYSDWYRLALHTDQLE